MPLLAGQSVIPTLSGGTAHVPNPWPSNLKALVLVSGGKYVSHIHAAHEVAAAEPIALQVGFAARAGGLAGGLFTARVESGSLTIVRLRDAPDLGGGGIV